MKRPALHRRHSPRVTRRGPGSVRAALLFALLGLFAAACEQQMADQPRYEPLEASDFFADGRASRPAIPGTVAQGQPRKNDVIYSGKVGGEPAAAIPLEVTQPLLERGRERYDIFCAPCHDRVGSGRGMIVQRGFRRPASFHSERLRKAPAGYFFDVMTNGFGVMSSYASQVPARDRWAIVAYIRALQLSQHARLEDVPAPARAKFLEEEPGVPR